ncbi:MAG: hypothetical protein H0T43_09860 [Solirubrobacterales bacterium]|nr:hypothetical protein [Solirubrobacterales bacterium]
MPNTSPIPSSDTRRAVAAVRAVRARRPRTRTLGVCAHCHEPVAFDDQYVRLHRRAWHLQCALDVAEPRAVRTV